MVSSAACLCASEQAAPAWTLDVHCIHTLPVRVASRHSRASGNPGAQRPGDRMAAHVRKLPPVALVIVARLRYRPSFAQMIGHIDHDAGLAATRLAKQQHGFELERGLVVEQMLPPAARYNFWEDDHR